MTDEEKDYFLHGILTGLGAAKAIVSNCAVPPPLCQRLNAALHNETQRVGSARRDHVPEPVDGEAEWQSWMIQMELQSWAP